MVRSRLSPAFIFIWVGAAVANAVGPSRSPAEQRTELGTAIPVITIREPASRSPGREKHPAAYGEALGRQIGRGARPFLLEWNRTDTELQSMRKWLDEVPSRRSLYDELVSRTAADFPGCLAEMRGIARGAGLEEDAVVMSNLRNELYMLINYGGNATTDLANASAGRSCTDVYLVTGGESTRPSFAGFAHNDDWMMDWRRLSYIIQLYDTNGDFRWSSWAYPSFLPGMDFIVNRHGLMASVQTLMPKYLRPHGASAWGCVTRRLVEARSLDEALRIVRWPNATAGGFAVNMGWHYRPNDGGSSNLAAATLVSVETYVDPATNKTDASSKAVYNGAKKQPAKQELPETSTYRDLLLQRDPGIVSLSRGGGEAITYFHGNEYRHAPSGIAYHPSDSTRHRRDAFLGARDVIIDSDGLRDFLGNTTDNRFPVYRTPRPTDAVWTEATGLFDVGGGTLGFYPRGRNPIGLKPNVVCSVMEGCRVIGRGQS